MRQPWTIFYTLSSEFSQKFLIKEKLFFKDIAVLITVINVIHQDLNSEG